jgi:hypothetical protein
MMKTRRQHELCSGAGGKIGLKYFLAWEQGKAGANQPDKPASRKDITTGFAKPADHVSTIGTVLETIIEERGGKIACGQCRWEVRRLNMMTKEEANAKREELGAKISESARTKSPKLYQRIAAKVDHLVSSNTPVPSLVNKMVLGWIDESIKNGEILEHKKANRPANIRGGKVFTPHGPKVEEHPLPDDVRKNLIYHIYPMQQTRWLWQWNLDQIIQRIDLFNGRRVVAIVHDGNSDHPDAVKEYLKGHGCEFIIEKNSRKGESVTAMKLMDAVKSFEHEVTFRAHAKGVSKIFGKLQNQQAAATLAENGETVHKWTEIMYATCLDDWETVRDQLGRFAMTGPYRKNKGLGKAKWYFSGSFYWYHHVDFYQRRWQDISAARTGVESLPGELFNAHEVGCLHDDDCGSLYHYTYMRDTAWPAFEKWKRQRED